MALIISLETSTSVSSVALYQGLELVYTNLIKKEKSHSGSIVKMIQNAVDLSGFYLKDLEGIAVSKGPGSYTGLRIGTSVAKGLCLALDIPLLSVNTLKSMALGMNNFNIGKKLLCPMIDARRMEVYCMVFDYQLQVLQETMAKIIDENSFGDFLEQKEIIFFGDGAEKSKKWIGKNPKAFFVNNFYPQASNMGSLAYQKFQNKDFEDLAYFEPYYLKEFIGVKSLQK